MNLERLKEARELLTEARGHANACLKAASEADKAYQVAVLAKKQALLEVEEARANLDAVTAEIYGEMELTPRPWSVEELRFVLGTHEPLLTLAMRTRRTVQDVTITRSKLISAVVEDPNTMTLSLGLSVSDVAAILRVAAIRSCKECYADPHSPACSQFK